MAVDYLDAPRVFVRVYQLPDKLTNGYCFGGGVPITFTNVDWFEASKDEGPDVLIDYIKTKRYYKKHHKYLVLGDTKEFQFVIE